MKSSLLTIALALTMIIAPAAKADQDGRELFKASFIAMGATLLLSPGTSPIFATTVVASSANLLMDNTWAKELVVRAKSDIQAYNVGGEVSPLLESFINEMQKENPDLSTEDIISSIENNL
jgi:hypothetical protein